MFKDAKQAVEFGIMFAAVLAVEPMATLLHDGNGKYAVVNQTTISSNGTVTSVQLKALTRSSDWSDSAYDAMLKAHMELVHGATETILVDLTLPQDLEESIDRIAAQNGVTRNDVIIGILDEEDAAIAAEEHDAQEEAVVADLVEFVGKIFNLNPEEIVVHRLA